MSKDTGPVVSDTPFAGAIPPSTSGTGDPPPALKDAQSTAKPTTGADIVHEDKDNFPGGAPELPPGNEAQPAPGSPAQPVTAAKIVNEDRDQTPTDGGKSTGGRPRMEDTAQRARWRDQKSGKFGKKGESEPKPTGVATPILPPQRPAGPPVDYEKMAGVLVDMSLGITVNVLGPEWAPKVMKHPQTGEELNEKTMLVSATANYLRAKQMPDLPPGVLLAVVIVAYAAPRFTQPVTKGRVKFLWEKLTGLFKKKKPAAKPDGAPIESTPATGGPQP